MAPMRRLLLLPLALAASGAPPAPGGPAVFKLSPEQTRALVARLQKEAGKTPAVRAKFTQTTESPLLQKPAVASGILLFRRAPLAFRYEYGDGRVYALEGGRMSYWLPAQRQAGRLDLRRYESRISKYADPLALTGRIGADYEIAEAMRDRDFRQLLLKPGPKQKRSPIEYIDLHFFDRGDAVPLELEGFVVEMKTGDRLTFAFSALERNPPLQPDAFSVKIPAGVPVRESLPDGVAF